MADIPGYYYDEEKNRHFKIMPTGPYSLASINQRKREREKQEEQHKKQQIRSKKRQHPMDTSSLLEFHRQRSCLPSLPSRSMVGYGAKSIFKQLTPVGSIPLSLISSGLDMTPLPLINHMAINTLSCNLNQQLQRNGGDILIGHQDGLITRYGFQVAPFFQAWSTSWTWNCGSNITSLHFGQSYVGQGSEWKQTVIGTSMGHGQRYPNKVWRYSLPLAPPLDESAIDRLTANHTAESRNTPVVDPSMLSDPLLVSSFEKHKDTFWSSFVADEHDVILVGGERRLYILSSNFNCKYHISVKSAIFTTHLVDHQPQLAWIGRRDGTILLVDTRQKPSSDQAPLQFHLSSAVTHLKPLPPYSSGHAMIAGAMDGSLSLLDTRFSIPFRSTKKRHLDQKPALSKPVRQFYGHTNDHSRDLAFDVDLGLHMMAMAGDDNVVRLWSLKDQDNEVHPFWSSKPYSGQVCQASILSSVEPPSNDPHAVPLLERSNPGLLVCAPTPSLDWFSLP